MAETRHLERLSATDHYSLLGDDYGWPWDIGAIAVVGGTSLLDDDGRVRIDKIRRHVETRLHLLPRFRQVLHRPRWGLGWPVSCAYTNPGQRHPRRPLTCTFALSEGRTCPSSAEVGLCPSSAEVGPELPNGDRYQPLPVGRPASFSRWVALPTVRLNGVLRVRDLDVLCFAPHHKQVVSAGVGLRLAHE